ncbi:signal transduction histidine kinase [Kibdelosporangium banguiense]|uniref:histidine kinase n=1 Tax=Kibdelosporangium banguiense TaxID=1365924 RepID=A0ABS4T5T9_9PSEU|nr:ATP-binding protein [Kibdelosporangium banguiense]MBP2319827.1 signal transduction histidine kinase [Kibdelosporangium banguiense]
MRGRVAIACAVAFVLGCVLAHPGFTVLRTLMISFTRQCSAPEYWDPCPIPYDGTARTWVIVAFVVVIALIVWFLRFCASRSLRPLHTMTSTVRQLGPQNLGQRIRRGGANDELRVLSDSVDEMLDRVVVGFEGQRRFASNASHELRTPLAVQRTLVEVAMVTGGDDQEINRLGAQLLLVNERNERLIEGLLVLAESDRGLPGTVPVRLDQLASEVLDSYSELAAERGLTVRRGMVERTVQGDPVLLERMISNLLHNAIKYNDPGGWIEVVVAGQPAISVHNSGQAVPAEAVSSLFEPFRRLTAERTNHRDGAGLGLSIVRSIVAAHQGAISAKPGEDGGLRLDVHLPSA